jgi:GNAT superfamily N-acetyltransferase
MQPRSDGGGHAQEDADTMNTGTRAEGGASLELVEVDRLKFGLNAEDHKRVRMIQKLRTEPECRQRGDATWLLASVCAEADADGTVLMLEPRPFDDCPMDADQLREWYERCGFVVGQAEPAVLMLRAPNVNVQ